MSKAYNPDFISGGTGETSPNYKLCRVLMRCTDDHTGDWKHPKTTFTESFNLDGTREAFETQKNRYAKFRNLEHSPNGVLLYSNPK